MKEQDPVIPLVKVDATANPKLAQKYEIQGYPTIRFFILGEPIEYQGGRTSEEIVGWIKRKTGPAVTELSTFEQIEEKANVTQVLVVLFGAKSGENFELFEKFAKTIDDVTFAVSEAGKEQYGVKEGDVVMFKHFDERRNDCNCVINEDNLKNFVERNMYPIVAPFDEKLAEKIFGEGNLIKLKYHILIKKKNFIHILIYIIFKAFLPSFYLSVMKPMLKRKHMKKLN